MSKINRYRLIFFLRYLGDAFFASFISLYLLSLNIEGIQLGFILSLIRATPIIFNPLWGLAIKKHSTRYRIVGWMILFEAILIMLFGHVHTFGILAIIIFAIGMISTPYESFQDGIIGDYCYQHDHDFATVRIFGTLAYIIATALGGFLITYFGFAIVFIIASLIYVIVFILWKTFKKEQTEQLEVIQSEGSFLNVIKNKDFLLYMVVFVFGVGSLFVGDHYFNVYLESRNIDIITMGLITAGVIFVELVVVNVIIKTKFNERFKLIIFLSILFVVLRNVAFAFNPPFVGIIIFSSLRGIGWGGIISVHLNYLVRIIKKENFTNAIMLLTSVFSLFVAVMDFVIGAIYKPFGFTVVFLVLLLLSLISLIAASFINDNVSKVSPKKL